MTGSTLVEVRVRYKGRDEHQSQLIAQRYAATQLWRQQPSTKFRFAAAVAELALQLRGSQYLPRLRGHELQEQLASTLNADAEGAIAEVLELTRTVHAP